MLHIPIEILNDVWINIYTYSIWELLGFLGVIFLLLRLKRIRAKRKHLKAAPRPEAMDKTTAIDVSEPGKPYDTEGPPPADRIIIPEPETVLSPETVVPPDVDVLVSKPEQKPAAHPEKVPLPEPKSIRERLKSGMSRTRHAFTGRLEALFADASGIDEATMEEMEEILITSDVGMKTTMALTDAIYKKSKKTSDPGEIFALLKNEIRSFIKIAPPPAPLQKPLVIMVVGVNGVGKTTTIGKLALRYANEGKQVLLGAADTFRAAAVEQLETWAKRTNAEIVRHRDNSDPAAVAFDSVEAAITRGKDVVIIDTAGRLHTKVNLMEELKKIRRSIAKRLDGAPHEVLLVVDATTGQNAISQARLFHEGVGVTSIALTKLDGTAKGGIVIGISNEIGIPIRYIGVGEGAEDLQPFDPDAFVDALF